MNASCRITGAAKSFSTETKRFYVDDQTIVAHCPICGEEVRNNDYLSYPPANKVFEVPMYHDTDEDGGNAHEFTVRVVLRIFLEAAP